MDRRIIVMRHAKSAWPEGTPDHERPLNNRGKRDAPRIAQRLAQLGWTPDSVLSSDSARTRETFERMAEEFSGSVQAEFLPSFYEGGIRDIRGELCELDPEIATVLLLGHNPGWEAAVEWFCGTYETMKTANAALLEGSGATWREAVDQEGVWKLRSFVRPGETED